MPLDATTVYAFFLVFVRCSGMFIAAPMFGAANAPVTVRVYATLALSMALTAVVRPHIGEVPPHLGGFVLAVANEAASGLLIGAFFSLVLHAATLAGSFVDLQMGLGLSQALNPVTGIPVTVVGQFKYLLCLILFLQMNAHHLMLGSFVQSYASMPTLSAESAPAIQTSLVGLVASLTMLGIQMAAPVAAVSFVVDAALGLVNRAVPQMQSLVVGMPAKVMMGMIALSVGLPALAGAVVQGVERTTGAVMTVLEGAR
jgi:flagellar biosynthetic protein FliR